MKRLLCIFLAFLLLPILGCSKVKEEEQSAVPTMEPPIAASTPEPTAEPINTSTETPEPTQEPESTKSPGIPLRINPEIGKHEVKITIVSVENPNPPDEYEIKQISETPFIETEGRVSEKTISTFWELYAMLPDSVRESFEADGFKILITKKNLDENYYAGEIDGFINGIFSYQRKTIFLYGTESALKASMLHEFGHYLDWKNGFPSRTEAFKPIYDAEKDVFDSPYINTATEFFAEVFQEMLKGEGEDCPQTVTVLQSILERFENSDLSETEIK